MTFQEMLALLGKDTLTTEGKFEDVLVAQLGKIGQTVLDLEAIAKAGRKAEAEELAQQLDEARSKNDGDRFNELVQQIEAMAAEVRGL